MPRARRARTRSCRRQDRRAGTRRHTPARLSETCARARRRRWRSRRDPAVQESSHPFLWHYRAVSTATAPDRAALAAAIKRWSAELGFTGTGIAAIDLAADEAHFLRWLADGFAGEMAYMARHGVKRSRPAALVPGTISCISVRIDYWPAGAADAHAVLAIPQM